MYADYLQAIIKTYQLKKKGNLLANNLLNPTCAKIKNECKLVCEERLGNKDASCIRTFFGGFGTKKEVDSLIEKMPLSKFKPLDNFLKNDCLGDTDDKNIELLAWLIDYQPRPFDNQIKYVIPAEPDTLTQPESTVEDEPAAIQQPVIEKEELTPSPSFEASETKPIEESEDDRPNPFLPVVFIVLLGFGIFWLGKNSMANNQPLETSCMYWIGDRYVSAPCNKQISGAMLIALDTFKLNNFRRITTPDTITYASIGIIWYMKPKRDSVEYYTVEGFHPTIYNRRLKPLTKYMIDTHILKKNQQRNIKIEN